LIKLFFPNPVLGLNRLPAVTDTMIDEVLGQVYSLIETTNPKELKPTLKHFIEK